MASTGIIRCTLGPVRYLEHQADFLDSCGLMGLKDTSVPNDLVMRIEKQ